MFYEVTDFWQKSTQPSFGIFRQSNTDLWQRLNGLNDLCHCYLEYGVIIYGSPPRYQKIYHNYVFGLGWMVAGWAKKANSWTLLATLLSQSDLHRLLVTFVWFAFTLNHHIHHTHKLDEACIKSRCCLPKGEVATNEQQLRAAKKVVMAINF